MFGIRPDGIRLQAIQPLIHVPLRAPAAAQRRRAGATIDEAKGEETRGVAAAPRRAAECAGKSPPPAPRGRARRALVEAAGIEPASAVAPGGASTSVGCPCISPAGRWTADLPSG